MDDYLEKIDNNVFKIINNLKNPKILELGVKEGVSTKRFLNLCNKNDGYLYSVDIEDYSKVSNDERWKFIKSRDDNFDFIISQIPNELDVIYIDTLHEAKHVKNIFYNYYNLIKPGGYIFIDDISHLPYVNKKNKTSFYCEINNRETFQKILEIYYYNYNKFYLNFSFQSSGLAIIKKINNEELSLSKKIKSKEHGIKNIARKIWLKIKNY